MLYVFLSLFFEETGMMQADYNSRGHNDLQTLSESNS